MNKYLNINNYLGLFRGFFPKNIVIDKIARPVSFEDLNGVKDLEITHFNISGDEYLAWVYRFFPTWKSRFGNAHHKKLLEFFTSFSLLEVKDSDVFMDVGGGGDTYIQHLQGKTILQDIEIADSIRSRLGEEIHYIESDAAAIPVPNGSVDKIGCHHSFEHFQDESDILFIREVQRILKPHGRCCIVPVLISDKFIELTDFLWFEKKFDERSKRVIDPTATLPGGPSCGNYARIYDLQALHERIVKNIDSKEFNVALYELIFEGRLAPDLSLSCHKEVSILNHPYRALLIERFE